MTLTYGSLFSGTGMLDEGVQSVLGGELSWYAEFDAAASKVMAHHYPGIPNLGDVTKVDWASVPHIDILTGGSPCQDLSHAGKRAGMTAGTRSNLWVQMREAIAVLRPRLVVWENVRGALSASADSDLEPCPGCMGDPDDGAVLRALGRVLGDLADLGYDARWYGLRAADVGAPHGRFRIFLFAVPADATGDPWWLSDGDRRAPADAERGGQHGWTSDALGLPIGGTAAAGSGEELGPTGRLTLLQTPRTSDTNGAGAHGQGGMDLRTVASLLPTPTSRDHKGRNQRDDATCLTGALLPTPRATDGTNGGPNQRGSSGDLMLPSAVHLLPTPAVNDMGEGKDVDAWDAWTERMRAAHGNGNGHGKSLAIEAQRMLLPTPTVDDAGNVTRDSGAFQSPTRTAVSLLPTPTAEHRDRSTATATAKLDGSQAFRDLGSVAELNRWGDYAPAIARWEAVLGRPAPAPTEVSTKSRERCPVHALEGGPREADARESVGESCACKRRLSPEFVSWMMGLPAGWVTDLGLTRNEELKILGNGVVPQQAAAATWAWVCDMRAERAA